MGNKNRWVQSTSPSILAHSSMIARWIFFIINWNHLLLIQCACKLEFGFVPNLSNYAIFYINFICFCDISEKNVSIVLIFGTVIQYHQQNSKVGQPQDFLHFSLETFIVTKLIFQHVGLLLGIKLKTPKHLYHYKFVCARDNCLWIDKIISKLIIASFSDIVHHAFKWYYRLTEVPLVLFCSQSLTRMAACIISVTGGRILHIHNNFFF